MEIFSAVFLYLTTLLLALWIGGGLLRAFLLPLGASLGKPGVFIADLLTGIAIAWIAIGVFHWAERDPTLIMVLLIFGTLWNDIRRMTQQIPHNYLDESRAREYARLQGIHLLGDLIGLGIGWSLAVA